MSKIIGVTVNSVIHSALDQGTTCQLIRLLETDPQIITTGGAITLGIFI